MKLSREMKMALNRAKRKWKPKNGVLKYIFDHPYWEKPTKYEILNKRFKSGSRTDE